MKTCTICNQAKPKTDFSKKKTAPDGLFPYCKPCDKERTAKYRKENIEHVTKQQANYREANRELLNQKARDRYAADPKSVYNARRIRRRIKESFCSPEQYTELYNKQNGCCAICKKTEEENGKQLAADHCHTKNNVRGLLCQSCNLMLGYAKDNAWTLLNGIAYLKQHM